MTSFRLAPRLLRVAAILLKYQLDDLVEGAHLHRPLKLIRPFFPGPAADTRGMSRGARLRMAMTHANTPPLMNT